MSALCAVQGKREKKKMLASFSTQYWAWPNHLFPLQKISNELFGQPNIGKLTF